MLNELIKNISNEWFIEKEDNKIIIENSKEKITIVNEQKCNNLLNSVILKHIDFVCNNNGIFQDFTRYNLELSLDNILDDENIKLFQIKSNNYLVCEDFTFDKDNFIKLIFEKQKKLNGVIFTHKNETLYDL